MGIEQLDGEVNLPVIERRLQRHLDHPAVPQITRKRLIFGEPMAIRTQKGQPVVGKQLAERCGIRGEPRIDPGLAWFGEEAEDSDVSVGPNFLDNRRGVVSGLAKTAVDQKLAGTIATRPSASSIACRRARTGRSRASRGGQEWG